MAARKSDAEKGPLGAWATHARLLLDESVEQAAAAVPFSPGTLRRIEGGSYLKPARGTVYALWQHFRQVGQTMGRPVEDPPAEWRGGAMPAPAPAVDSAAAINALVVELRKWREEDRERIADLERTVARLAAGRLSESETAERTARPAHRETKG